MTTTDNSTIQSFDRLCLRLALLLFISLILNCCNKIVKIPPPINSITASKVFANEAEATSAITAIYNTMSYGNYSSLTFSNGATSLYAGLSSDELSDVSGHRDQFLSNTLLSTNTIPYNFFWQPAYFDIYMANAVISGLQASPSLNIEIKNQLTGEAKFIRAFCYFYLTNLFGDLPLALSPDFNQTALLARAPQTQVYEQIIVDLNDAQHLLASDYSFSNGEHTRANKWAATALLARVYLYHQDWQRADSSATAVINSGNFVLMSPSGLDSVFLANSNESILQLQTIDNTPYATKEGNIFVPSTGRFPPYYLSNQLLSAFEPNDQRKSSWVDSFTLNGRTNYYPYKYKIRQASSGNIKEYYTLLRVAEQYLIRAEAEGNGAGGGGAAAIDDLNIIRARAGLVPLSVSLTKDQIISAIAQERRVELFAEWGHRWLDLKRWGAAISTLDTIALKQGSINENQLLYPIPLTELQSDPNLKQNPGYSND